MVTIRAMIFALAAAGAASAQEIDVEAGKNLFLNSCWQCHGIDAKGFGPMAEMLAIETPDLTELSKRNGGVFPTEAVAMQIDGRSPLLAHGGEMPIFGPSLESDQNVALRMNSGQQMMTGLPLANVIVYLESLQTE
jgi:mono/diheme cytochrome c family protein